MTYRFDCLGRETFDSSRWVRVRLYADDEIQLPIDVPATVVAMKDLRDPEVLLLWLLTDAVCTGRGPSVNGWPKWAIDISAGRGQLTPAVLLEELLARVQAAHGVDLSNWDVHRLRTDRIQITRPDGQVQQVAVEHFINDDCVFAEEPWQS